MIGGGGFPAAGLEVEGADFARGPILDFHRAVIIDGGGAGDDTNDRGGYFLPSVKFFVAGGWTEFKEPCAKWIDVERFAVEFGLNCGFALYVLLVFDEVVLGHSHIIIPFWRFGPCCPNWWMVADLLNKEAVAFIRSDVFVGLT